MILQVRAATPLWARCGKCRGLGAVDADQADGSVSIICTCGHHGYAGKGFTIEEFR